MQLTGNALALLLLSIRNLVKVEVQVLLHTLFFSDISADQLIGLRLAVTSNQACA